MCSNFSLDWDLAGVAGRLRLGLRGCAEGCDAVEKTRNLVEPAGAAALAAVLGTPERFAGRKVAIVCSGGNISPAQLVELWPREPA
jgi:threonine dehydratase